MAERLAGKNAEPLNYDRVPSATYCQPEVAGVGLTEAEARKRGYDVKVGKFNFGNTGQAAHHRPRRRVREGGVRGAKYDEVLGVHMIGPHATDLIAEACVALRLGGHDRGDHAHDPPAPDALETLMQAAEAGLRPRHRRLERDSHGNHKDTKSTKDAQRTDLRNGSGMTFPSRRFFVSFVSSWSPLHPR